MYTRVFAVICMTHLAPALIIYHWIFLVVATGLVKSRQWSAIHIFYYVILYYMMLCYVYLRSYYIIV